MDNKLLDKVNELRDQLTDLLVEKEELLTIFYQELNAAYGQSIGKYELYLYERELSYKKIKAKNEKIQRMIENGQRDINLYDIDKQVDKDFIDFENKIEAYRETSQLDKKYLDMEKIKYRNYKKLRKTYWDLARHNHPKLKKEASKEDRDFWKKVKKAFEEGDLKELETLKISLDYRDQGQKASETQLEDEISYLDGQIKSTKDYIKKLKGLHPYNKKDLLEDMSRLRGKQEELASKTQEVSVKINQMEKELLDLLSL